MPALAWLRLLAAAAALFCGVALAFLLARVSGRPRRGDPSAPQGDPRRGIVYAFGRGMIEKESVARHRPTFTAGMAYHATIFAAFGYVLWVATGLPMPSPLAVFFRIVLPAGAALGLGLAVKRLIKPHLRRLSCPDDFFANLLVDAFLIVSALHAFAAAGEAALLAVTAVLLVYVPLGKIRHCVFFFYTRTAFGRHFGRRGALPGSRREA